MESRILRPDGWEKQNGGRLAFDMDYSHRFYEVAQRAIWAELGAVQRLRNGPVDRTLYSQLGKIPAYRAAIRLLGR